MLCTSCLSGYYLDTMKCKSCPPECKTCKSAAECSECFDKTTSVSALCKCPQTYYYDMQLQQCSHLCNLDQGYYVDDNNRCHQCSEGCSQCSQLECFQCTTAYYLSLRRCLPCGSCLTPSECPTCQPVVIQPSYRACSQFEQLITKQGRRYCYDCSQLQGCSQCDISTDLASFTCLECTLGYYESQSLFYYDQSSVKTKLACQPCSIKCQGCRSSPDNCILCAPNRRNPPLCICDDSLVDDPLSNQCLQVANAVQICPLGYTAILEKENYYRCLKCPQNCQDCEQLDNEVKCKQCVNGYFINEANDCLKCDQQCVTCLQNA